jgi:F-type H+-transporting ATPase subunit b
VKAAVPWLVVFVVALVLAKLVDHGGEAPLHVPTYIWLALNLTLFLYVLARFVGKPMARFLETRGDSIREELEQAKRKLAEAEELRSQVLHRLTEVENEVAQLKSRAQADGQAEAELIAEQSRREEERFLRRIDDEIARRQSESRTSLARETAALTAQLAREILSQEMTDGDRRQVLDRSLAAMRALDEKERA